VLYECALAHSTLPFPTGVEILARHHFNSKLKRMSVVTRFVGQTDGCALAMPSYKNLVFMVCAYSGWVFVKGSPDAIAARVTSVPRDFDACVRTCAKRYTLVNRAHTFKYYFYMLSTSADCIVCEKTFQYLYCAIYKQTDPNGFTTAF
jgi:magnesium-transporting ATPase (P-type)